MAGEAQHFELRPTLAAELCANGILILASETLHHVLLLRGPTKGRNYAERVAWGPDAVNEARRFKIMVTDERG